MLPWLLGYSNYNMDWLTLEWLMKNLEWAVGLLAAGCIILFFFPIFLGIDLKNKAKKKDN